MDLAIGIDDPHNADVRELLKTHLAFSLEVTPVGHAYVLGAEDLVDPDVVFVGARRAGTLVGIGALRRLDATHAELKSMHTRATERRRGTARAIVAYLLDLARQKGCTRVSLETGTMGAFAPARALYRSLGFVPCAAFGGYVPSEDNTFMTISLGELAR